jgi:hypothetical protein
MFIQATSPRPLINTVESPEHIRIHTLHKLGVSPGDVVVIIGEHRIEVEPYEVFPLDGDTQFEAREFYLPFWRVFGTKKPEYNESRIQASIERKEFHRVDADAERLGQGNASEPLRLRGTQLALIGAAGYPVIVRSAFRPEGPDYQERIMNFTIHCPVTGGGIIRVTSNTCDIANPSFNPYAPPPPVRGHKNLTLQEAFQRTHRLRTATIEDRKKQRIAEAEANMRESQMPSPSGTKALPPRSRD